MERHLGYHETLRATEDSGYDKVLLYTHVREPLQRQLFLKALHHIYLCQPMLRARLHKGTVFSFKIDVDVQTIPITFIERQDDHLYDSVISSELYKCFPT